MPIFDPGILNRASDPPVRFHKTLPVDEHWECKRSGDCCRTVDFVVMTVQEQQAIYGWAEKNLTMKQLSGVTWAPGSQVGFVALEAAPCPFMETHQGVPTCVVHPVRPYNCRRFGCMRPDPKTEPLVMAPLSKFMQYGNIGCTNLADRLRQSRVVRRLYSLMQRKGQRWADRHGWGLHHGGTNG